MSEPVRPGDMRVSDAERGAVEHRLRRAHEVGQIDLNEFDERVQAAWAARTRSELERVTVDLPVPPSAVSSLSGRRRVFSDTGGGTTMRVLTILWLSILAVNLVVWGVVSLTTFHAVYPWWVWLAPSGAVLAVLYAVGIGRPPRSG